MRPAPTRPGPTRSRVGSVEGSSNTSCTAVLMSRALSWAGVKVGCSCLRSATTPVVSGAAMDVPLKFALPVPVPMAVEMMFWPGAATSGLSAMLPLRRVGPRELKLAIWSRLGVKLRASSRVTLTAVLASRAAFIAAPSAWVTLRAVMRREGSGPPDMEMRPAWLLAMMTPTAPAAAATCVLTRNVQVPRWMRAILPAMSAALVSAVQPLYGTAATTSAVMASGDGRTEVCEPRCLEPGEGGGRVHLDRGAGAVLGCCHADHRRGGGGRSGDEVGIARHCPRRRPPPCRRSLRPCRCPPRRRSRCR